MYIHVSKFRCKWSPFRFNWSLYLLNCCWEGVCACVRRPVVTGWEWFGWDNRVGYVCPLALWVQWPIVRLFFRNLLSKGRLPKARLAMRWAMVKMERQRMRGDCFWDHWLVDFSMKKLREFKGTHLASTSFKAQPEAPRKRPNYDSTKRKMFANPTQRVKYHN